MTELKEFINKIETKKITELTPTQLAAFNACSGIEELKEPCYRGFWEGLSYAIEVLPEIKVKLEV